MIENRVHSCFWDAVLVELLYVRHKLHPGWKHYIDSLRMWDFYYLDSPFFIGVLHPAKVIEKAVNCNYCGATAGEPCHTESGKELTPSKNHATRAHRRIALAEWLGKPLGV